MISAPTVHPLHPHSYSQDNSYSDLELTNIYEYILYSRTYTVHLCHRLLGGRSCLLVGCCIPYFFSCFGSSVFATLALISSSSSFPSHQSSGYVDVPDTIYTLVQYLRSEKAVALPIIGIYSYSNSTLLLYVRLFIFLTDPKG